MAKRVNYLNNKDLLAEIHKSKLSFCWYNEEQDAQYDVIVQSIDDITDEAIEAVSYTHLTLPTICSV